MREHELAEFELERDGVKIRMRKRAGRTLAALWRRAPAAGATTAAGSPRRTGACGRSGAATLAPRHPARTTARSSFAVVKSPIVGTFYRSPDPVPPPSSRSATRP